MAKFSSILRLVKLRPRKHSKCSSTPKLTRARSDVSGCGSESGAGMGMMIKWELRPGGMLVQKREDGASCSSTSTGSVDKVETISIRVSTGLQCYGISVEATSTVGELKEVVSVVTGVQSREQRLLFRGKEREDDEHLHMVGVRDGDKVVVFHSPSAGVGELGGFSAQVVLAAGHCPLSIEI